MGIYPVTDVIADEVWTTGTGERQFLPPSRADGVMSLPVRPARKKRELDGETREKILALYDDYRPRLFRYLASLHLGRDSADEVIQETFMRLTAELLKANEIENVQGWIVRVAHNLAIDLLKKQRDPQIATETALYILENRVDPALSPEEAYSEKEQSGRVKTALETLKPMHRECFQMRAHGFRYKDIAHALGISEQRAAFVVKQTAIRLAEICG